MLYSPTEEDIIIAAARLRVRYNRRGSNASHSFGIDNCWCLLAGLRNARRKPKAAISQASDTKLWRIGICIL
eukprot:gene24338-biopygen9974